jgi:hypothetical protein
VRLLDLPPGAPEDAVAVEVTTTVGTDVIASMLTPQAVTVSTPWGDLTTDGALSAVLGSGGGPASACLVGGTRLQVGDVTLTSEQASVGGAVVAAESAPGESWFTLDGKLPQDCVGQTLFVDDGRARRAYPIRDIADGSRVYTKRNSVGFEARPGDTWEFLPTRVWTAG